MENKIIVSPDLYCKMNDLTPYEAISEGGIRPMELNVDSRVVIPIEVSKTFQEKTLIAFGEIAEAFVESLIRKK